MSPRQELALFDLDHTLLPIDSDYEWADFLARTGRAGDPAQAQARNDDLMRRYEAGTLQAGEAAEFMLGLLRLAPPATLQRWRDEYLDAVIRPRLHPAAQALVARHQAQGHLCAIITSTNRFVTEPIAQLLGIDHLIATEPARDAQGAYTGAVDGTPSFGTGKVARLNAWLADRGQALDDFAASWFYSDSANDLPLLEHVTHPVATNPDARLRALAQARQWPILDLFADTAGTRS